AAAKIDGLLRAPPQRKAILRVVDKPRLLRIDRTFELLEMRAEQFQRVVDECLRADVFVELGPRRRALNETFEMRITLEQVSAGARTDRLLMLLEESVSRKLRFQPPVQIGPNRLLR